MEQDDLRPTEENIESFPQAFSDIDLELIPLLSQIDPRLASIVKGVRKSLIDIENPDRFHQSANSIRHLTALLVRNAKDRISAISTATLTEEQQQLLVKFSDVFNTILSSLTKSADENKTSTASLTDKFNNFKTEIVRFLDGKPTTTRQVLRSYFGTDDKLVSLQEFTEKRIEVALDRWSGCHDYFNDVAHYSDKSLVKAEEFLSKWEEIKKCALIVLRPFFVAASLIDEVINLEEPPNE